MFSLREIILRGLNARKARNPLKKDKLVEFPRDNVRKMSIVDMQMIKKSNTFQPFYK